MSNICHIDISQLYDQLRYYRVSAQYFLSQINRHIRRSIHNKAIAQGLQSSVVSPFIVVEFVRNYVNVLVLQYHIEKVKAAYIPNYIPKTLQQILSENDFERIKNFILCFNVDLEQLINDIGFFDDSSDIINNINQKIINILGMSYGGVMMNLQKLEDIKLELKNAIENKGVEVESEILELYPQYISLINSESDDILYETWINFVETSFNNDGDCFFNAFYILHDYGYNYNSGIRVVFGMIHVMQNAKLRIDWGDGTTEEVPVSSGGFLTLNHGFSYNDVTYDVGRLKVAVLKIRFINCAYERIQLDDGQSNLLSYDNRNCYGICGRSPEPTLCLLEYTKECRSLKYIDFRYNIIRGAFRNLPELRELRVQSVHAQPFWLTQTCIDGMKNLVIQNGYGALSAAISYVPIYELTFNGSSLQAFLYIARTLNGIRIYSSSALTDLTYFAYGATNLRFIHITECSNVSQTTGFIQNSYVANSLQHLILENLRVGIDISYAYLDANALNRFFMYLGQAIDNDQYIIITGNPGANDCDISIATNKGFNVII